MPSHYTLRMQFDLRQPPKDVTERVLTLVRESGANEIMFFCFGEEQNDGHDTLDRIRQWMDHTRPCREALKAAGVAVSLNPWHTVLHTDRGRTLKPGQDWQRMVGPTGDQASAVVCCLDANWRAYYFETLRLYAREGFRVVWIDDDIRYHNHGPLQWGGCFCPLHMAEFNRRAGADAGREALVAACLKPGTPHPWRGIWMDMWQETILDFLEECRRILEAGGTQMGLMSSSVEAHGAEGRRWGEWWRTFGGGRPPIHRPHFWSYSDGLGNLLLYGIAALDQNRSLQPIGTESGPEIECFPYGRWNKSFRQTFAQMALAHVLGSTNLNISLYDFMGNDPEDEPERAVFLRRSRPAMDWLADRFPLSLQSVGVGLPWSEDQGRRLHTASGAAWHELQPSAKGWAYWLGAAGIAFACREQSPINALDGASAWAFDEATLTRWLGGGLLLDGAAAAVLVERGFGPWIGVRSARFVTQKDVLYAMEECRDPRFAVRAGAQISVNDKAHAHRLFQGALEATAEVISDLRNPLQDVVGHGAFTFRNDLGGRVAVVPWDAGGARGPLMDLHRATQLRRLVEWLGGRDSSGRVEGGPWLVPQFLRDGATWRAVVWNAGPDEVGTVRLHRPAGMPPLRTAWHLTPDGGRHEAALDGDTVRLAQPLHQWELVAAEAF